MPGRELAAQLLEELAAPARGDLGHLAGEVGADAGKLRQLAPFGERARDIERELAHHARGVAVGAHAERVLVAQLEEVGDLLERARDVSVVDGHACDNAAARLARVDEDQFDAVDAGRSCRILTIRALARFSARMLTYCATLAPSESRLRSPS
jgi:hypothetical protein